MSDAHKYVPTGYCAAAADVQGSRSEDRQWGKDRGIVHNATATRQATKTLEEVNELLDAIHVKDIELTQDAVGDIVVTLIMVCAVLHVDLLSCLELAYEEIKDRKGHLLSDGTFVKDAP